MQKVSEMSGSQRICSAPLHHNPLKLEDILLIHLLHFLLHTKITSVPFAEPTGLRVLSKHSGSSILRVLGREK